MRWQILPQFFIFSGLVRAIHAAVYATGGDNIDICVTQSSCFRVEIPRCIESGCGGAWMQQVYHQSSQLASGRDIVLCDSDGVVVRDADGLDPGQRLQIVPSRREGKSQVSQASIDSAKRFHGQGLAVMHTDPKSAKVWFDRALQADPNNVEALVDYGVLLEAVGDSVNSSKLFSRATELAPKFALAFLNLGAALTSLRQWGEALAALRTAKDLLPPSSAMQSELHNRMGIALLKQGWALNQLEPVEEAVQLLRHGARTWPANNRELLFNLAEACLLVGNFSEAVAANREILEIVKRGDVTTLQGAEDLLHSTSRTIQAMRHGVRWDGLEPLERQFRTALEYNLALNPGSAAVMPLHSLYLSLPKHFYRRIAQANADGEVRSSTVMQRVPQQTGLRARARLRVGYWTSELRHHPVSLLMEDVFGLQCSPSTPSSMDIHILALNPDDTSGVRQRIASTAGPLFVKLDGINHVEVYQRVAALRLDVLIDLDGYSGSFFSHNVLMLKLAPVQMNFLGYPGTLGAAAIPYIGSDRVAIVPSAVDSASERLVMLPHALMATKRWTVAPGHPSIAELEGKFVLGSFHKAAKINPVILNVWRNMARRIPNAVLWLTRIAPTLQPQLESEVLSRGLMKYVIHDQVPTDEVWAGGHHRIRRAADIAVDTPGYNGHTTVAELLWVGVPPVTVPALDTMAARIATSLVTAANVPQLALSTYKAYEDMVILSGML